MGWISQYYDRRVAGDPGTSLLWQVGHTENGQPITEQQFQAMVGRIRNELDLQPEDQLLDLCCGNGVFTRVLAGDVQTALGVDFSPALIAVAQANSEAKNLTYHVGDARNPPEKTISGDTFNKVLMNAALQHFSFSDFQNLLEKLVAQTSAERMFLFAFVPDAEHRDAFEATLKPGLRLRLRRMFGRDLIGHWYSRDAVTRLCKTMGLSVEFLPVDPSIDGSRYRFNILIR
jgi:cyclopropane fatty-acyl-phospholipid synthase-like methyltransferase